MENVLNASYRDQTGKVAARQLRRRGEIPGVCYGHGRDTFKVSLDPDDLAGLILGSPKGRNTVIALQTNGESHQVMVQEVQKDPLKRVPVHVDFRLVTDDDYVVVPVPVVRSGRSRTERAGGRLVAVRRSVNLRCQVRDIPDAVDVDVTELRVGGKIRASDLVAPPGCEIVYKADFVVVATVRPRGEAAVGDDEEGAG
jgi:large subunit ribosomal protein L25